MGLFTFKGILAGHEEAKELADRKKGHRLSERDGPNKDGASKKRRTVNKLGYDPALAALGCAGCPLNEASLEHPKMPASGAKQPQVLVLGEAPGAEEDEQGIQFVGKAGKVLRQALPKGYEKITRFNNSINCRPPANRAPSPQERECCRVRIETDIEKTKPKVIIGTGAVPLEWRIGQTAIGAWRGRQMPVKIGDHVCWFVAAHHPSYIMRIEHAKNGKEIAECFKRDLAMAYEITDKPSVIDPKHADDGVEYVT